MKKKMNKNKKSPENENIKLVLKGKWYDMICSGKKKVEYRELKPYWCTRIKGLGLICPYAMPSPNDGQKICQKDGSVCKSGVVLTQKTVTFSKGYTSETATFRVDTYSVRLGDPALGAPERDVVICIGLGDRIVDVNS